MVFTGIPIMTGVDRMQAKDRNILCVNVRRVAFTQTGLWNNSPGLVEVTQ